MKKLILFAALAVLPFAAGAQDAVFAGRASVGADYKIVKGLHAAFEEELRTEDSFDGIKSLRHTLEMSWKPLSFLKVGAGYTLITPIGENDPRHRVYADLAGSYSLGDFQFSLKERFQLTNRPDTSMNIYQNPRNAMALKSRFTVKYKRFKHVEPYAAFEIRTFLNGAWGSTSGALQTTNKTRRDYYDYTPGGYTHIYNNRYRIVAGVDVRLAKHHWLTPYVLMDKCSDYEIDTNKEGTRLFVDTTHWVDTYRASLGLSYVYKF